MEENNQNNNSYKMVNFSGKEKNGMSAGKNIFVPFISGVVGACLVVGVCFGVPTVREKVIGDASTAVSANTTSVQTTTPTAKTVELTSYSDVGAYAASKIMPSIVKLNVEFTVNSIFGGQGTGKGGGSGIILSEDGYIVTNSHVINTSTGNSSMFYQLSDATRITVKLYNDDTEYEAKVIGSDATAEIAVIKIDKTGLTPAEIGNSDNLKIGEFAMVAGNPVGMDFSVTTGSIGAINREVSDNEGNKYTVIQTDAAINSGNSGGALVNSEGKVIGITFMKLASTDIEGICFAIPITPSMDIIQQLIENGKVKRPYIGIEGTTVDANSAKRYNMPQGVYVNKVDENSNAAKAGLQARDIIIEIDGNKVTSMDELNKYKYSNKKVGDTVTLKVNRNGEELDISFQLLEEE